MKKVLIISQDEIHTKQNHNSFCESIDFCKDIASKPNLSYTQLARFEHKNGLLYQLVSTYIDNSRRNANIIFDSPNNISNFNKIFPKNIGEQVYKEIFSTEKGIRVTNIRNMIVPKNYNQRINPIYSFTNSVETIFNNYDYVILHHGGSDILYYFVALNQMFRSSEEDQSQNLKKVILVNRNHIFDNLLMQYKLFREVGNEKDTLHENITIVNSLHNCLDLLEEDIIYNPTSFNKQFTID